MTTCLVNSDISLQAFIGDVREAYQTDRYLKISYKSGKGRSLSQNDISHAWYEQLARELREDNALGWKCYCKLHHGVPILRAEDDGFREIYDTVLIMMSYEKKLTVMKILPVTSTMTKSQLSQYLTAIQTDFLSRGVRLEFPAE